MVASAQPRRARGRVIVLGLFALVTLVAPLLHHDFDCHQKSRLHCDSCTASRTAPKVESGVTLIAHLGPMRPCVPENVEAKTSVEGSSSPGRAPPRPASFV